MNIKGLHFACAANHQFSFFSSFLIATLQIAGIKQNCTLLCSLHIISNNHKTNLFVCQNTMQKTLEWSLHIIKIPPPNT
jgi:hypothetical protein